MLLGSLEDVSFGKHSEKRETCRLLELIFPKDAQLLKLIFPKDAQFQITTPRTTCFSKVSRLNSIDSSIQPIPPVFSGKNIFKRSGFQPRGIVRITTSPVGF